MKLLPQTIITEKELEAGKKNVIRDGLATESMTALTDGAFRVALALLMGASYFPDRFIGGTPRICHFVSIDLDMAGETI
jgi:hypothetical protein